MTSDPIRTGLRISPYARRLAAQLGIPMADLVGTGPGGEVGAKDVRRAGAARYLQPSTIANYRDQGATALSRPGGGTATHP